MTLAALSKPRRVRNYPRAEPYGVQGRFDDELPKDTFPGCLSHEAIPNGKQATNGYVLLTVK